MNYLINRILWNNKRITWILYTISIIFGVVCMISAYPSSQVSDLFNSLSTKTFFILYVIFITLSISTMLLIPYKNKKIKEYRMLLLKSLALYSKDKVTKDSFISFLTHIRKMTISESPKKIYDIQIKIFLDKDPNTCTDFSGVIKKLKQIVNDSISNCNISIVLLRYEIVNIPNFQEEMKTLTKNDTVHFYV